MIKGKILIADDNLQSSRLMGINLEFEGYKTISAYNEEEFLKKAELHNPDLIILDVLMPKLNNWQILTSLKSNFKTRNIPIIMITAVSEKEDLHRGFAEGITDFISKPFNPLRLIKIVEKTLNKKNLNCEKEEVRKKFTNIAIIVEEKTQTNIFRSLLGDSCIQILGIASEDKDSEDIKLAQELDIFTTQNPWDLLSLKNLDLIIDIRKKTDSYLINLSKEAGVEVLSGYGVNFMWQLLEEREEIAEQERALLKDLNNKVKELSILNEMSKLLTAPFNLERLLKNILILIARIIRISAGAIFLYNEDLEKYITLYTLGLNSQFKELLKFSINDSLIKNLQTLNEPLIIPYLKNHLNKHLSEIALINSLTSGAVFSLKVQDKFLGFIILFTSEYHEFNSEELTLITTMAAQAAISIENIHLYQTAQQKQKMVEKLLSQAIQTQEEERKRISAELHDGVAQSLVGILTKIQTCHSLLEINPKEVEKNLKEIKNIISDNVKETREIIFNLRPASLDDLGLISALENYVKRFENENKIKVILSINTNNTKNKRLPSLIETAVFRIIQEALTNVKRHAMAKKVTIKIKFNLKNILINIHDYGKGFIKEKIIEKISAGDSYGISGMSERVSMLGGNFKILSIKEKGTKINIEIPSKNEREK